MTIISSVVIWGAAAVILLRILGFSGVRLGNSRTVGILTADTSEKGGFDVSRRDTAVVFGLSLSFRAIVFLISIFAIFLVYDNDFSVNHLWESYMQWDAHNYDRIATGGYGFYTENGNYTTLAFFPLYPWLIRLLNPIFGSNIISGIIVSALCYSGACAFLYKLLALDYCKPTAIRTLVYLSVFPHALFFGVMMNESLLLFTMAATLYYIRRHDWSMAGIFGALAAMSRMVGILLAIPAAVEWLEHYKIGEKLINKSFGEVLRLFVRKGLWIFLMLFGIGVYLFCNYKTTGDWFKFLEYQKLVWNNGSCYFGKSIQLMLDYARSTTGYTRFAIWIPELAAVAFMAVTLVYGIRRTRSMYTAFLLVYFIINVGFEWPISVARYVTCAIPSFVVLSDFSERHKWTEPIITTTSAIAFGVFFTAYFMSRQIL